MDSTELTRWQAWDRINPFGHEPWQLAAISSTIHNMTPGMKRTTKPEDYMPKYTIKQVVKGEDASKSAARDMAEAFKAAKIKKPKPTK